MLTQDRLIAVIGGAVKQHRTNIRDYSISYIVAGHGPAVLLLHGVNMGWAQWFLNIAELAKHFTVYAIDLPGAGSSTEVEFSKTDFMHDFVEVVDEFIQTQKLTRVDLIGSSFGGWIALKLALAGKPYVGRLVLANPLGFTTHMPAKFRLISFLPFARLLSRTVWRPSRDNKALEAFIREVFYNQQQPLAPEFINYFYELSQTSHMALFTNRMAHWSGMRRELYLQDELPQIKQPVLVIWGKADPLMPYVQAQKNLQLIPHATIMPLDNAGHLPPIETSELFNETCIKFLQGKRP